MTVLRNRRWILAALLQASIWLASSVLAVTNAPTSFRPKFNTNQLIKIQLPAAVTTTAALSLKDAGDHYTLPNGEKIHLLRSSQEVVVGYANGKPRAQAFAELQKTAQMPQLRSLPNWTATKHGNTDILRGSDAKTLAASSLTRFAYPVLYSAKSKTRMVPTDELLMRLAKGVPLAEVRAALADAGVEIVGPTSHPTLNTYRLRLTHPKTSEPLDVARKLSTNPKLAWAVPNFIRELNFSGIPNDPLFSEQQSLLNTGQNGAIPGADVSATNAWEITVGDSSTVIAILDTGVDIHHSDLLIAPGGSNFVDDTSDPSPGGGNYHGTACAGIAAATINNTNLIAGMAGGSSVLPLKIADDNENFVADDVIASAIAYAADHADVLSDSWGGGDPDPVIDDAISYAVTSGRGGLGCPVFFATGNSATSWLPARLALGPIYDAITNTTTWTGQYYIGFIYQPGTTSVDEQTARIDNVRLVGTDGYTHLTNTLADQDFEGAVAGWFLAGDGDWYLSNDNTFTGTGGSLSAASPTLTSTSQNAWLLTPLLNLTGTETLAFEASLSMSTDSLLYVLLVDASGNGIGYIINGQGAPDINTALNYPASNPNVIAIGASTDCDFRSDFSQYAGNLDCVAPGGGGWNEITTLDPTGSVGETTNDFETNFEGTSAACPLAAGVGALILSANPGLSVADVRQVIHSSCDQIGGVTYFGGTNLFYGYGRINAYRAVVQSQPDLSLTQQSFPASGIVGSNLTLTLTITNVGSATASDVALTNLLPANAVFLAATPTQGTCATDAFGNVICSLGTLTNNTGATVTLTVQPTTCGTLTNSASVTSSAIDANPADNTNTVILTVISLTDTDCDGIPDAWTLRYFGHPTGMAGDHSLASDDADGTGFSNLQKYLAGLDPTNSASTFRIVSIIPQGIDLNIKWTGGSNSVTVVQASLSNGSYTNNFTDISPLITLPSTTYPTTNFIYQGALTNSGSEFFRVRVVPFGSAP